MYDNYLREIFYKFDFFKSYLYNLSLFIIIFKEKWNKNILVLNLK